mgnify:CR=1 FL=1
MRLYHDPDHILLYTTRTNQAVGNSLLCTISYDPDPFRFKYYSENAGKLILSNTDENAMIYIANQNCVYRQGFVGSQTVIDISTATAQMMNRLGPTHSKNKDETGQIGNTDENMDQKWTWNGPGPELDNEPTQRETPSLVALNINDGNDINILHGMGMFHLYGTTTKRVCA